MSQQRITRFLEPNPWLQFQFDEDYQAIDDDVIDAFEHNVKILCDHMHQQEQEQKNK